MKSLQNAVNCKSVIGGDPKESGLALLHARARKTWREIEQLIATLTAIAQTCWQTLLVADDDGVAETFGNPIRFETLESRLLLSAVVEVVPLLPEADQGSMAVVQYFDAASEPALRIDLQQSGQQAVEASGQTVKDIPQVPSQPVAETNLAKVVSANGIEPSGPVAAAGKPEASIPEKQVLPHVAINVPPSQSSSQLEANPKGFVPAARALGKANADLFNNASTVPIGDPQANSTPSAVSPDPIAEQQLNPAVWGDWMPQYQRSLQQANQFETTQLTIAATNGTTTRIPQNSLSDSPAPNVVQPGDSSANRDKPRIDLSRQFDDSKDSSHKPASNQSNRKEAKNGPAIPWQIPLLARTSPIVTPITEVRIEISTAPRPVAKAVDPAAV